MPTDKILHDRVTVDVETPWYSKINWTQIIAFFAMGVSFLGFDLTAEHQAQILAAIVAVQGVITIILRTFFTDTVTPSAARRSARISSATPVVR